ncbi:MFS_1 domain-containing protein [Rhizoctonia solani AG-1 IA]|uniref:MFS_1 domain-containing protein n=1 Tax=Thanatephorus cucumeris (strain AG1-IA) TaxID=983506 RepID=L8X578_THACA|nr:MFS_1 domain-containing protein [Rhizoctonia solani AG-1 IA]
MTTDSGELDHHQRQGTMASPSPTITPSIRHSSDTPKANEGKEGGVVIVDWLPGDPENPMNWKFSYRRSISLIVSDIPHEMIVMLLRSILIQLLCGCCSRCNERIRPQVGCCTTWLIPFRAWIWAWAIGMGTLIGGKKFAFLMSFVPYTLFHLGAGLSKNIQTLLVMRLLGGCFGSSVFSVPGGNLADMFTQEERGPFALVVLAVSPLLGPLALELLGDADFLRNGASFFNSQCHPVLLKKRAARLKKVNPNIQYMTKYEGTQSQSPFDLLRLALSRPILLLTHEPIVLALSFYTALVYGTLYGLFAAYPIVFVQHRHFTYGENGLAFLGIGVGILLSIILAGIENKRYIRAVQKHGGHAPPEERLIPSFYSAILLPVSLIWFAW